MQAEITPEALQLEAWRPEPEAEPELEIRIMTEPDPLADLAAQLEELRRQWVRSQGEIGALREQLKSSTGQQMLLHSGQAARRTAE